MGIFLNLHVSMSVTKEEWDKVYVESLKMVEALPLADRATVNIGGTDTICLVDTREKEYPVGYNNECFFTGWKAIGDSEYFATAEDFTLKRDLPEYEVECRCNDAYKDILWDGNWQNREARSETYHLWGGKTQGEPYHFYLLAIGCMVESRLGMKAVISGDITRGQCREAVEYANTILDDPIGLPDRCYPEKLIKRVRAMDVEKQRIVEMFEQLYMGNQDADYGEFIRSNFSGDELDMYWIKEFKDRDPDEYLFERALSSYLLWGFEICDLHKVIDFGEYGAEQCTAFIGKILDTKVYVENKNCKDHLTVDQDSAERYGIATQFAHFMLGGFRSKKINRYIPLEELCAAISMCIGDKCDVDSEVRSYLSRNEEDEGSGAGTGGFIDDADAFNMLLEYKANEIKEDYEEFDIADYPGLIYYEPGNSMTPGMENTLKQIPKMFRELMEESPDDYNELSQKTAQYQYRTLVSRNSSVFLMEKDWQNIYDNLQSGKYGLERYYILSRIKINSDNIRNAVAALYKNDDLYEWLRRKTEDNEGDSLLHGRK